MSRFQIRKRIKSALGRNDSVSERDPTVELTLILPDGSVHVLRTEPHYTLVMASQTLDTPIHTFCPDGHCGECQVEVLAGHDALRPPTEAERDLLDETLGADRDPNIRLACHARLVGGGARVRVGHVWSLEGATRGEPLAQE